MVQNDSTLITQHLTLEFAPIVLFVYNRPDHTKQTVEALQKNELAKESKLFIYSDAAKNEDAVAKVNEVREYIKTINGFKKVTIIEREKNWGLANSIIDGVTKIVNEYGKIIVLEDDLVTSPYFLKFMNEALEFYKDEEKVYSITGYSFTDDIQNIDSSYFLSITSSWSWATWAVKWKSFQRDKKALKEFVFKQSSNKSAFNFNDSYDYTSLAKWQLDENIDSWAIYWYFSVFQKNGLTLYPSKSLVHNIGFDGSGVHCAKTDMQKELNDFYPSLTHDVFEKPEMKNRVSAILKTNNSTSSKSKMKNFVKKILSPKQKQLLTILLSKIKLFFYKKDIGENSYVDKTVHALGWNNISIGNNCVIGEYTWLNVNHKNGNFKHIKIGNNCYVGKRAAISSAKQILIKDYCLIGDDCKFLGASHIHENPLEPYATTGATNNEIIAIGVNVWLGTMVCIVGNVSIGHGSIIGAGSVVTKNIPPFCIAVGNPCKVIKRFDFEKKKWISIDSYDSSLDIYMPAESEYLMQLKSKNLNVDVYKLAGSHSFGDLI